VDYALTELVHCKSGKEQGVPEALDYCVSRYFRKVLTASGARVIVGLGKMAKDVIRSEFQLSEEKAVYGPLDFLSRQIIVTFLPHPNARMVRSFDKIINKDKLIKLRSLIN